jgi:hypothetical protein
MNNAVYLFKFKLIITLLFSYGYGQQQINDNMKCRQNACNFDWHKDAAVRHGAHHLTEYIKGYTGSHWMLSCKLLLFGVSLS